MSRFLILKTLACFLFISLAVFTFKAYGQDAETDSLLDKVLFGDDEFLSLFTSPKKFQFIYARTNYENKTYFAGRDLGISQYNLSAQLFYFHSIGFHAGMGGVWYSGFEPKLYTVLVSAGYSGKIDGSGDYRYRVSFDKYFFSKNDSVQGIFSNSLNFGGTVDKGIAGSRLDFSLLTGKETGMQISWDLYSKLELLKLGSDSKIKFEPEVSFYFGTEEVVFYEIGRGSGVVPRNWQIIGSSRNKFGLLNTEIILPVCLEYKNFDFEAGYNINFPRTCQSGTKLPVTSYFNFSVGYIFSLN